MESGDETVLTVKQAFRELRQILYWHWDPLGVNDAFPENDDEYDSYAWRLLSALYRGLPDEAIAPFLQEIAVYWFGHSTPDEHAESTAKRIAWWRMVRGIGD